MEPEWNVNSAKLTVDLIRHINELTRRADVIEQRLKEHEQMISKLNTIRKALVWVLEASVENKAVGVGFALGVALGWYIFG